MIGVLKWTGLKSLGLVFKDKIAQSLINFFYAVPFGLNALNDTFF